MTGFKLEELLYFQEFENNLCGYAINSLRFIEEGVEDYWIPFKDGDGAVTILKDSEILTLSWIATTVEEAKRILERNESLLEKLFLDDYQMGYIGCPHCEVEPMFRSAYNCGPCAWRSVFSSTGPLSCLQQAFGGYNLNEAFVQYGRNHESIENIEQAQERGHGFRCENEDDMIKYMKIINAVFLGGHIEWSLMVINGKIPPVDEPFRTWSNSEKDEWHKRALEAVAKGERRR